MRFFWFIIAGIGGAARYLQDCLKGNRFHFGMFIGNVCLSGFSGLMFALFGKTMSLPQDWHFVLAGVGGFMGANALEFITVAVKAKLK